MPPRKGKKKDDKKDDKKEQEKEPERPDGQKTWIVGGWSEIQQVGDALIKATEGDKILLNPGTYSDVEITKPACISGYDHPELGSPILSKGFTCLSDNVTMSNLVIHGDSIIQQGNNIIISKCKFLEGTNLLSIWPYSDPRITECIFSNADKGCLYCFPNAKGVITKCEISGTGKEGSCGIILDNAATKISSNIIKGPSTGIYAFCQMGSQEQEILRPEILKNDISFCTGTGFHLDNYGDVLFKGNVLEGIGYWAVSISNKATGTFSDNTIKDKIRIKAGCKPTLISMSNLTCHRSCVSKTKHNKINRK